MEYRTVFDASQGGFQWWIPLLMAIFGALFFGIGWILRTSRDGDLPAKCRFFQTVGGVSILGSIVFFAFAYLEHHNAQRAFATKTYSVTEGVVSDFIPMPPGGHSTESFVVNSVHFEYGSGWGSTAFNSDWNKGFIHNGVEARITYVGKDIIKVEVK
jgi:hypothetical protein